MVVDFPVSWTVCSMVTRMLQPHSHSSSRNDGLLSPRMCTHDTIILTVSIRRLAVATTDMYGVGADFELHLRRVTPTHKMATLRFSRILKCPERQPLHSGESTVALMLRFGTHDVPRQGCLAHAQCVLLTLSGPQLAHNVPPAKSAHDKFALESDTIILKSTKVRVQVLSQSA